MRTIAALIGHVLTNPTDERIIARVGAQVDELCDRFPLYAEH
jgi:glycine/serine hydroxymethyltransferase